MADIKLIKFHLEEAKRHIMEAEQRIAIQEDIIEKLAAQGHSTVEAEKILKTFTDTLKTMYAHRDTIMAELEMAYKNSN